MKHLALAAALLLAMSLTLTLVPGDARAEDEVAAASSKQTIEVVGFSNDGREVALRVIDENIGTLFQVRDSKRNEVLKAYPFQEDSEKSVWRKVKRVHDMADELVDAPDNPRKPLTLMTAQKGAKLIVYVMKGDRIGEYEQLQLLTTKKGEPAKTFVKQMAWDGRGKYAVLIYHQKITDLLEWEGDFVHVFKFKSYRASFGEDGDDE